MNLMEYELAAQSAEGEATVITLCGSTGQPTART